MSKKRCISILLTMVMVFTTVFSINTVQATEEETSGMITVYVAVEGSDGADNSISIGKTAVQVPEGSTGEVAVEKVLKANKNVTEYDLGLDSEYGANLNSVNGLTTVQVDTDWFWWNFGINGVASNVNLGNYTLQDNDKLSFVYTSDYTNVAVPSYQDDISLNPDKQAVATLLQSARDRQAILATAIYEAQFDGAVVPGIENANALYTVFSLIRAGYQADDFYQAVYAKVAGQLEAMKDGGVYTDAETGTEISDETILASGYAELTYAKIVLLVSAMGYDATDINGYNLIEKMASKTVYEGSSSYYTTACTMLLAMDSSAYTLPEGADYINRTDLVNSLTAQMDSTISTSISWGVDMAAMLIQPLAAYTKEDNLAGSDLDVSAVQKACNKGIHFLESMQSTEGLYGDSYNANNVWTLAQVMLTMGQFGASAVSEDAGSDFIKNGKTVLDAAAAFVDVDKTTVDASLMRYQPEQLLRGFNACIRVADGLKGVYDTTDSKATPEPSETPMATPEATSSAVPDVTPSATSPVTITGTDTPAAIVTQGAVRSTKSLKVAKSKVVVKPGKSCTVKYTVKASAGATQAAVVTVKSANKKVATATKITGSKIKIQAPKKATKGAATTVTLTSGAKKARIKVYVSNATKKVKATKSVVTVKKGKKVKISWKVTAQNKKKAITDTVKTIVKKSNLKVVKKTVKTGKVTVTVKGLKKGKSKITLKAGNKKSKVTVKVK